jgi:quinol monooxygenase YgiN
MPSGFAALGMSLQSAATFHSDDHVEEESDMWAQQMTLRVKPGSEAQVQAIDDQVRAIEQPDSGVVRTLIMRDQQDPTAIYVLSVFESEEKARAREQDPRRAEGLQTLNAMMAEVLAGPPEFVDLEVLDEITAA